MVKHTQTIRRQMPTSCLSVFDHFVILALKGLINIAGSHFYDIKMSANIFRVKPGVQNHGQCRARFIKEVKLQKQLLKSVQIISEK